MLMLSRTMIKIISTCYANNDTSCWFLAPSLDESQDSTSPCLSKLTARPLRLGTSSARYWTSRKGKDVENVVLLLHMDGRSEGPTWLVDFRLPVSCQLDIIFCCYYYCYCYYYTYAHIYIYMYELRYKTQPRMTIYLFIYLSIYLSIYLHIYLSICLCIYIYNICIRPLATPLSSLSTACSRATRPKEIRRRRRMWGPFIIRIGFRV